MAIVVDVDGEESAYHLADESPKNIILVIFGIGEVANLMGLI